MRTVILKLTTGRLIATKNILGGLWKFREGF
jgi:hypothetical protein